MSGLYASENPPIGGFTYLSAASQRLDIPQSGEKFQRQEIKESKMGSRFSTLSQNRKVFLGVVGVLILCVAIILIVFAALGKFKPSSSSDSTNSITYDSKSSALTFAADENKDLMPNINTPNNMVVFGPSNFDQNKSLQNLCVCLNNPAKQEIKIGFSVKGTPKLYLMELAAVDYCIVLFNDQVVANYPKDTSADPVVYKDVDVGGAATAGTSDGPIKLTTQDTNSTVVFKDKPDTYGSVLSFVDDKNTNGLPITNFKADTNTLTFRIVSVGTGNLYFKLSYSDN